MAAGWLLFMVFCGAGLVALPLDMIREFLGRPKSTITKSEYMTRAKALGNKAKRIVVSPHHNHSQAGNKLLCLPRALVLSCKVALFLVLRSLL